MFENSLLIVIGHAKEEPWETIWHEGQLPTWVSNYRSEVTIILGSNRPMSSILKWLNEKHENFRYLKVIGRIQGYMDYFFVPWARRNIPEIQSLPSRDITEIQVQTSSALICAGRSNLGFFKWFLEETKHEYLFLTVTSSFVNVPLLKRFVFGWDKSRFLYAGTIMGTDEHQFVSGSGMLFNRMTLEMIVKNAKKWPHQMLNDVALGTLLKGFDIFPLSIPSLWVKTRQEVLDLSDEEIRNTVLFRCKTATVPRTDSQIMNCLQEKFDSIPRNGNIS